MSNIIYMMQDIKEIFGKNVQKFRRRLNMTQEQLAEALNVSQAFLANIERGKRGISMENIETIAHCFSVPYSALFEIEENNFQLAQTKATTLAFKEQLLPYLEKALQDCFLEFCKSK